MSQPCKCDAVPHPHPHGVDCDYYEPAETFELVGQTPEHKVAPKPGKPAPINNGQLALL